MRLAEFILAFLLLTAQTALACSCLKAPTVKDNWRAASQVFIGQVERVDTSGGFYSSGGGSVTLFTVRVLESFKREVHEGYPLRTFVSSGEGACDSYFRVGEKYLIYAYGDSPRGMLKSSLCDRTGLLEHIEEGELELVRKLWQEAKGAKYVSFVSAEEFELNLLRASNEKLEERLGLAKAALATMAAGFILLLLIQWRNGKL
ncbi:hypothetical protein ACD591_10005 [Rufibacter glacialis]|uniref:Tissue inhibitor of metalloproteinase n=1 Tax=Rufibacter glacialis TaxID=1259555 RepID=A0A5M8QAR2_9BACT|nr:hypothetical protein [Rufibacter glacialis]KAA6431896.1 hypothetical protein FOE74_17465 [Rufibacter glacialis]GGK80615.1 hypothetical protein GCM10011405_30480 [Rufibacter glacialis]